MDGTSTCSAGSRKSNFIHTCLNLALLVSSARRRLPYGSLDINKSICVCSDTILRTGQNNLLHTQGEMSRIATTGLWNFSVSKQNGRTLLAKLARRQTLSPNRFASCLLVNRTMT